MSVNQPGAREDVWRARPGGDGSPARDAGGPAGWLCGSRCAAVRRSRCAPGCFVLIGLVVVQRHASGDVSNHGEAYTTNGFLDVPF